MKLFKILLVAICIFPQLSNVASAQQVAAYQDPALNKHDLVQFSGVVVESDSLRPIPYSSIMIKKSYRGTVSDYFGYFSFVAQEGDTIEFTAIGFSDAVFVIPDTLTTNKYSLIQVLASDTIRLKEAVVYPWPTKEQFKEAFLKVSKVIGLWA